MMTFKMVYGVLSTRAMENGIKQSLITIIMRERMTALDITHEVKEK